ncbi:hypothetical protein DVH24_021108 [Malus domestica]|uniref:ADP/ATP translocase n=1 Tax=Malus domestica TaxID=3750 RepID=A0A498JB66_MALDO|nr:hypothetical protein DVH24_021108 [Malus domestica]
MEENANNFWALFNYFWASICNSIIPFVRSELKLNCVGIIVYHGLYFGMYDSLKPVVLTVKYSSSLDAFKQNIKNEGAKSLFKGVRANILRAVASANVLAGYDKLQVLIIPLNWSHWRSGQADEGADDGPERADEGAAEGPGRGDEELCRDGVRPCTSHTDVQPPNLATTTSSCSTFDLSATLPCRYPVA